MIVSSYKFENDFTRLACYDDEKAIKAEFGPLAKVNELVYSNEAFKNAYFFNVKTEDYDDIHKAMKYGVWSSDYDEVNTAFSNAFQMAKKEGKTVYLVWQAETSANALGVSKLMSDFNKTNVFDLWYNKSKEKVGAFTISWVYIKTIDLLKFSEICNLSTFEDGEEIEHSVGLKLMNEFCNTSLDGSLFDLFPAMDLREDRLHSLRKNIGVEIKLTKLEGNALRSHKPSTRHPKKQRNSKQKPEDVYVKKVHKGPSSETTKLVENETSLQDEKKPFSTSSS